MNDTPRERALDIRTLGKTHHEALSKYKQLCRLLEQEVTILQAALEDVARRGSPVARTALISVGNLRKSFDRSFEIQLSGKSGELKDSQQDLQHKLEAAQEVVEAAHWLQHRPHDAEYLQEVRDKLKAYAEKYGDPT